MYQLGLIGNCQTSALIDQSGAIAWLCLPRPDSPPVFGRILDEQGGHFAITPTEEYETHQRYLPNTNVLVTTMTCADGSELRITDFCPRFEQHGRMYRPMSLFRIVEPIKGAPTIRVSCRPVVGWEREWAIAIRGNSHVKYEIRNDTLRVVTNMSLTYLCEEAAFTLQEKLYFGVTWGTGIGDDLEKVTLDFLDRTIGYWQTWVKHCSIPTQFQNETIRSALALKLHCYEDTGAILAALTTSLPEDVGQGRNWDYRFCWLRDAAFVLSAFHNLGHFEEMEGFLKFLLNIAHKHEHSRDRLRPVYALDQTLPLPEREHLNWQGYCGSRPVRSNNQAAEHVQNDVYGEMILTLAPIFFDERFWHLRTEQHENLLLSLTDLCIKNISKPDAGLWEFRNGWQEHSFSNLMSWAGIERVARIKEKGFLQALDGRLLLAAKESAERALKRAIQDGSLRNGPDDKSLDAALLLLPILHFPDLELCKETVAQIAEGLRLKSEGGAQGFLYRYTRKDDFGTPNSAFLLCSFWLVQALAQVGNLKLAREVLSEAAKAANQLGLFSEHFFPGQSRQGGNYPQAYSHVGMINAAFSVSPPWSEIL
ncbi:MAG: glycoside hydrolase family 15 protein [Bdellovibrionales bacterium]